MLRKLALTLFILLSIPLSSRAESAWRPGVLAHIDNPCRAFRNNGDGTYTQTETNHVDAGSMVGSTITDLNETRWLDTNCVH